MIAINRAIEAFLHQEPGVERCCCNCTFMRCFSLFNSLSGKDGLSRMSDASGIHWLALSLKPDAVKVAVSDAPGRLRADGGAQLIGLFGDLFTRSRLGAFLQHRGRDVGQAGHIRRIVQRARARMVSRAVTSGRR